MAKLDAVPQIRSTNPLDLLLTAATPHGYGVSGDGKSAAVKVRTHAPKIKTGDGPLSAGDLNVINDVQHLFQQARNYRRPMGSKWKRDKHMLFNRPPGSRDRPDWLPTPLVPEILPLAAALVGWMTDQRIGYTVAPTAVPNTEYFDYFQALAQDLEAVMDATWQANSEESQWSQCIWDAVTYGTGFVKTTWDMTLSGGQGDAISRRVSPWSMYLDPAANDLNDAEYIIEAKMMSCGELERRYPGSSEHFPDGGFGNLEEYEPTQLDEGGNGDANRLNNGNIVPGSNTQYGRTAGNSRSRTNLPAVLVLECWIKENNTYTTTDMQSGEPETRTYDTWRVVVVAGNRVLMDEPADNLWAHGGHPYSRLVLWDQSEFWGRSLVEQLIPCQIAINRILAALQQNVELTGNPVFKQSVQGANNRQLIANKPGQKIPVAAGDSATGWLNPPPIQQAMMQLLQYHLSRMEEISGISGIAKGASPGGRPAQSVVDSLQESVFVRVRQHLKELEYTMRDAGYKRASLIVENYTGPRMMAIAGPSGERTSLTLKSRHFLVPTSEGAFPMKFSLGVDAGSRMHTSRSMREDRAIQLYTLGLVDRDAALSDLNYPNAAIVAKRQNEREQQMAAMGQQAGPGARQRAGH